ncbi:MAG TPA: hypothetical protein V6C97_20085 [Oculatellaceae cyanobacterium]
MGTVKLFAAVLLLLFFVCRTSALAEKTEERTGIVSGASAQKSASGHVRNDAEKSTIRLLHFPADKSIGTILIGRKNGDYGLNGKRQIAGAMGDVRITVPAGCFVLFEANRRVFQEPALLDQVSKQGIDRIKLGFIAMSDSEDGWCDRALSHVSSITGLKELDLNRSEATDKGLSCVKHLNNLEYLSCLRSDITGSFFQDLAGLPHFAGLDCSWCSIEEKNLKYLSSLKHLERLSLNRIGLSPSGLKEIAKCSTVTELRIESNPKLTNDSLKELSSMKNLRYLDLRMTNITIEGLRKLKGLPLTVLAVPQTCSKRSDVEELLKTFPRLNIHFQSNDVPQDIRQTYAPLKWGAADQ